MTAYDVILYVSLFNFSSILHNTTQFKLQNRIFRRLFSSKGAHFAFSSFVHWNIYPGPHLPTKLSGAGAATGSITGWIMLSACEQWQWWEMSTNCYKKFIFLLTNSLVPDIFHHSKGLNINTSQKESIH